MCAPSACEPVAEQHRPRLHIGCEEPRLREGGRRAWCQSPWKRGRPSATTSRRRWSGTPWRIHDVPRPLKSGNLCGDGHGRREDGHTDKSGTREEAGGGDGATRAPGRGGKRTAGGGEEGQATNGKPERGHLGNAATHAPVGDNGGARRTGRNDLQHTRTQHVANPAEGDRVHPYGELRGPHGDEPGQLPPTWEERTHTQSIDHGKLQRQRSGDGLIGDGRVSLMDHSKTVSPTCPVGGTAGSGSTAKTATTQGHWETGFFPRILCQRHTQQKGEAPPRVGVMFSREMLSLLRRQPP